MTTDQRRALDSSTLSAMTVRVQYVLILSISSSFPSDLCPTLSLSLSLHISQNCEELGLDKPSTVCLMHACVQSHVRKQFLWRKSSFLEVHAHTGPIRIREKAIPCGCSKVACNETRHEWRSVAVWNIRSLCKVHLGSHLHCPKLFGGFGLKARGA